MEELIYEDREIVLQVLAEAIHKVTDMQMRCLLLCWLGFTQEEVGRILDVTQQTVQEHFAATLSNVEEIARGYLL